MAKSSLRHYSVQESSNVKVGGGGMDIVAPSGDTATLNAHRYVAITALTETVATLTSSDNTIWDDGSVTIPVGVTIYGNWSQVVIADGDKCIVYREHS